MTRADLEQPGLPIRLSELVRVSGYSRHKLYADIERGELAAYRVRCGSKWLWYVHRHDAALYLSLVEDHRKAS